MPNPTPPGQHIRPERRCAFLGPFGARGNMLKLPSGLDDFVVFEGRQHIGQIRFGLGALDRETKGSVA